MQSEPTVADTLSSGEPEPLLEVRNLRVEFPMRSDTIYAVNDVSFVIHPGETLGIVGESGCGKSVTALSIMRLLATPPARVVSGEILFRGRDLLKLSRAEMQRVRGNEIAMSFQDPMTFLNPVLTIGRQITEALEQHKGMSSSESRVRAMELLDLVGISSPRQRLDEYPHQFSGGMRQRVMIAIALSCDPQLLIADEPTTAVDVTIQAQILELIKELQEELGMALMLITHDLGVVAGITDRIQVMYAGQIVEMADTDTTLLRPRHPYTSGLLQSIPRLDEPRRERLVPIEGTPPSLNSLPVECPFAPRCSLAFDRCSENPPLRLVGQDHWAACWAVFREDGQ